MAYVPKSILRDRAVNLKLTLVASCKCKLRERKFFHWLSPETGAKTFWQPIRPKAPKKLPGGFAGQPQSRTTTKFHGAG